MATDMNRACDGELAEEQDRPRCDGCGGVLEPWHLESPVIYDCFHALHAGCAHGRDACPRCRTPRRVHDDDDPPEPVDEAAANSLPDSGEASGGCCACSRRVAELESSLEQKSAALTETTNVLEKELERAQSRLCRLEEMYGKLEEEFIRLRDGKRAREIEDDEERKKKPWNGGRSASSFPPDQTD